MTDHDLIDTLNDLVQTCLDGEQGFLACAGHAKSSALRRTLETRADSCRIAASELRRLVAAQGGTPDDHGTLAAAAHRGWIAVRGALKGHDDVGVLEECERGEEATLDRYVMALRLDLPPDIRMIVERQCEGVRSHQAEIRLLRDQERIAAEH